ncbi:MAG: hypothetical protein WAO35_18595 [Terriglobia bacterium]
MAMDKVRSILPSIGLAVIALLGILIVFWLNPGVIRFKAFSAAEFTQQLTPLALVALFIERGLEIILTAWRGGQEARLRHNVDKAKQIADKDPSKLGDLHAAEDVLTDFSSATQRIALPAAIALGILISALGIRGFGTLLDTSVFAKLPAAQQTWFTVMDVLLTGSLLGGGSDFVHKVITTFTDLMEATSQKAKA